MFPLLIPILSTASVFLAGAFVGTITEKATDNNQVGAPPMDIFANATNPVKILTYGGAAVILYLGYKKLGKVLK